MHGPNILKSVRRLSSVCRLYRFAGPTHEVETFRNISLAILWPPCKILRRSSQEKLFVGGVKRKMGRKIVGCNVWVYHLLMSLFEHAGNERQQVFQERSQILPNDNWSKLMRSILSIAIYWQSHVVHTESISSGKFPSVVDHISNVLIASCAPIQRTAETEQYRNIRQRLNFSPVLHLITLILNIWHIRLVY